MHALGRVERGAAIVCVFYVLLVSGCESDFSEDVLIQRTSTSRPDWQTYQEDIKGSVGASPVAQWKGEPVRVSCEGKNVAVTFLLHGPWGRRNAAIPVLIRDPMGGCYQNISASHNGDLVAYQFELPEAPSAGALPWLELKFPREERRIVLSDKGMWTASP